MAICCYASVEQHPASLNHPVDVVGSETTAHLGMPFTSRERQVTAVPMNVSFSSFCFFLQPKEINRTGSTSKRPTTILSYSGRVQNESNSGMSPGFAGMTFSNLTPSKTVLAKTCGTQSCSKSGALMRVEHDRSRASEAQTREQEKGELLTTQIARD